MASFSPWVLPRQIPRPSGSDSILHRLLLIFLGKLLGPNHQLKSISIFNTFDPCVLDNGAVLLFIVDGTILDPREAFNDMGNSSKDGVGIVLVTRDALETNGTPFLTDDDVKVCYPLGKPSINTGNPQRDSEPCSGRLYTLAA